MIQLIATQLYLLIIVHDSFVNQMASPKKKFLVQVNMILIFILRHICNSIANLDDCKYTSWSEWSKCNASCGQTGDRIRRKSLTNTNALCAREIVETIPCTGNPCPCIRGVNCTCDLTNWNQWSRCSLSCGGGQRERTRQYKTNSTENCTPENVREIQSCNVDCCSVDGKFTSWTNWTECTKTCG